eukprot:403347038
MKISTISISQYELRARGECPERGNFNIKGLVQHNQCWLDVMFDRRNDSDMRLVGDEKDKVMLGSWGYLNECQTNRDINSLGKFVIRGKNQVNYQLANSKVGVSNELVPSVALSQIRCFCQSNFMKQFKLNEAMQRVTNFQCHICQKLKLPEYFSCNVIDSKNTCGFIMCLECIQCFLFIDKMKLLKKIKDSYKHNRQFTTIFDYVTGIFRDIQRNENSIQSLDYRKTHQYRWFEVYSLDEDTFEFKLEEEIELYVNTDLLGSGHFHDVQLARQRRDFVKNQMPDGSISLTEKMLLPPKEWVIKNVKKYDHLPEVPYDIAKQYMAMHLANAFCDVLNKVFLQETIFLKYVQPYMAVPLFKQDIPYVYELERYQESKENIQFDNFSRPKGDPFTTIKESKFFGQVRLPHCFSHWTYVATDGNFMVTDIQGWKLDKGKYLMTDPIVFSKVKGTLGNIDWGQDGMIKWMNNHECNDICKKVAMYKDDNLIRKLNTYLQKFVSNEIQGMLKDLKLIAGT